MEPRVSGKLPRKNKLQGDRRPLTGGLVTSKVRKTRDQSPKATDLFHQVYFIHNV